MLYEKALWNRLDGPNMSYMVYNWMLLIKIFRQQLQIIQDMYIKTLKLTTLQSL